jgi:hypothetical protein
VLGGEQNLVRRLAGVQALELRYASITPLARSVARSGGLRCARLALPGRSRARAARVDAMAEALVRGHRRYGWRCSRS